MLHRYLKSTEDNTEPSSHANYRFAYVCCACSKGIDQKLYRYLNSTEKSARLHQLHSKARLSSQQVKRLATRLEEAIERRGIQVDDALHRDLSTTMAEKTLEIKEKYPPGSFLNIFWEQQERACKLKNAKSMRWEPAMIRFVFIYIRTCIHSPTCSHVTPLYLPPSLHNRWCIYLRHLSSAAYEMLRCSGVFMLPSQRTLRDYTYYTRACLGFSASVDRQMMDLAKIDSCRTLDKYVIVIMDEMHVKEDIVYDKHTGMYCINYTVAPA